MHPVSHDYLTKRMRVLYFEYIHFMHRAKSILGEPITGPSYDHCLHMTQIESQKREMESQQIKRPVPPPRPSLLRKQLNFKLEQILIQRSIGMKG